jgi:hypothetical protein
MINSIIINKKKQLLKKIKNFHYIYSYYNKRTVGKKYKYFEDFF